MIYPVDREQTQSGNLLAVQGLPESMNVFKTTSVSSNYHPTSSLSQLYIRLPAWHVACTCRLLVRVPTYVGSINHHTIYSFTIEECWDSGAYGISKVTLR